MSIWDGEKSKHKSFEMPGAKPHYNPDRPGQVEHIKLTLSLDIPNQSLQWYFRIKFRCSKSAN
jgi:aminopeptidase N